MAVEKCNHLGPKEKNDDEMEDVSHRKTMPLTAGKKFPKLPKRVKWSMGFEQHMSIA